MRNVTAIPSQGRTVSLKGKQLLFQNCQWLRGAGRMTLHSCKSLGCLWVDNLVTFLWLPPSFPPGLHGPEIFSSAELGEASSGKLAGIWIHFRVAQTDAFLQWA